MDCTWSWLGSPCCCKLMLLINTVCARGKTTNIAINTQVAEAVIPSRAKQSEVSQASKQHTGNDRQCNKAISTTRNGKVKCTAWQSKQCLTYRNLRRDRTKMKEWTNDRSSPHARYNNPRRALTVIHRAPFIWPASGATQAVLHVVRRWWNIHLRLRTETLHLIFHGRDATHRCTLQPLMPVLWWAQHHVVAAVR